MSSERIIYLDNNATTIAAPEVVQAVSAMLADHYANPSSIHHFAETAAEAIKISRALLGRLLDCRSAELVFTSGATESIATAFHSALSGRDSGRIVATTVEHPAVLENVRRWSNRGFQAQLVGVDEQGRLELSDVEAALGPDTILAAFMIANNETGVLFPIAEIVAICRERGIPVLLDACQSVGKVPLSIRRLKPDYLALSAHKFHGPKGVGALYVRRGAAYEPLLPGGGQERARRSGTENVPGIVGLGVAAQLAQHHLETGSMDRIATLRDSMEARILDLIPDARINGDHTRRIPNTSNISFEHASGEALLQHLDELGIAASSSSACASNEQEPSHVLRAMRVPESHIHGSMRIGLSTYTTQDEIDTLIGHLPRLIELARAASPFVGSDIGSDFVGEAGEAGDPKTYC
jgi:cysteine desulfurase